MRSPLETNAIRRRLGLPESLPEKRSADKPFFNPKAKIDESQIIDRTPTDQDIREKFIARGKWAQSVKRR